MNSESLHTHLTYLGLPEHLKSAWLSDLHALPAWYLLPPVTGEEFEDKGHCQRRLNGFAKLQGFAVVLGDSKTGKSIGTPR